MFTGESDSENIWKIGWEPTELLRREFFFLEHGVHCARAAVASMGNFRWPVG